jgi:hypothetical protein
LQTGSISSTGGITAYMHLDSIVVKVGDEVKAGQKLGVSGNTGTRTTGEHLHFGVKTISADGKTRDVDPASYLAEIAQKGNLKQQALYNGNDLLTKYKGNSSAVDTSLSPDDWMKKLLSSEDASTGLSSADPIMGLVTTMYSSLLALAVQIDSKSEEEQKTQISEAVSKRQVDLKPLMPTMNECVLSVGDNGKAVLQADNGTTKVTRELTNAEFCRLSQVLGDNNLSNDAKKMRIAGMVNTIVLTQQASQNYEHIGGLHLASIRSCVFHCHRLATASIGIVVHNYHLAAILCSQHIIMLGSDVNTLMHLLFAFVHRVLTHTEWRCDKQELVPFHRE